MSADLPVTRHGSVWRRFLDFAVRCYRTFSDPDTSLRCAGTAFFGFLSLFPAVATAVLVFGIFADRASLTATIEALEYVLPSQVLELMQERLTTLVSQPPATLGLGLLISIPLALWSGSRGVNSLVYAMSRVRHEPERRSFVKAALVSIILTIVGSVFLVVSLIVIAGLPALFPWPTRQEWLLLALRWPILLVMNVAALSALYRWGPDRHPRRLRYILPGAIFASLLWIIAGAIFSFYIENFASAEANFGSVASAVVLLLWLYNSAQIFVLGAVVNSELEYAAAQNHSAAEQPRGAPDTLAPGAPIAK